MNGMPEQQKPFSLPIFRGYTVDERLEQFRKMTLGKRPEFIPFSSKKGQSLLRGMERSEQKEAEKEWRVFLGEEGILGNIRSRIQERVNKILKR